MFGADLKNKTAVYAAVLFYGLEKPLVMREFANKIIEWNIIKVKRIILPRFLIRRSTYAGLNFFQKISVCKFINFNSS